VIQPPAVLTNPLTVAVHHLKKPFIYAGLNNLNTDETQIKTLEKDFSLQPVTEQFIGAAFEVHNVLSFGFLEKVYQRAMQAELQLRGVKVELKPKW
jgi:hypothetical protein